MGSKGKILCAIRGGEGSVPTQEAAIALALEGNDELVFFYVVNVDFLADANYALHADIVEEEIEEMGDFLMDLAVDRAEAAGVEARSIIKHGEFVEELCKTAKSAHVTLIVLGRPADDNQFDMDNLLELAASLEAKTTIPVKILPEISSQ
jgi:nucleotide-binding universal stress UspA family protein